MQSESIVSYIVWTLIAGGWMYMIFRIVKFGGFRGALYGAKVLEHIGELEGEKVSFIRSRLNIHLLLNKRLNQRELGCEIVKSSMLSWRAYHLRVAGEEARIFYELVGNRIQGTALESKGESGEVPGRDQLFVTSRLNLKTGIDRGGGARNIVLSIDRKFLGTWTSADIILPGEKIEGLYRILGRALEKLRR